LSNNTILEANTNTANEAKYKKSITVSNGTYNRLLKAGRFSDRSFDKVIARLAKRFHRKGDHSRDASKAVPLNNHFKTSLLHESGCW
jgi:hypothetical protein